MFTSPFITHDIYSILGLPDLTLLYPAQLKVMLPYIRLVPDALREVFLDDVCQFLYDAAPKRPDGMVHGDIGPYDYLLVVARK